MSCLEFRRAVMVDPRRLDAEARAHAECCASCRELLAHSLGLEDRMAEALKVPVPEGLAERVLGRMTVPRRGAGWLALAASIVVAIAVAAVIAWPHNDPLARAGIDFVLYEEAQAILDAKPADRAVLQRVATGLGIALPGQIGEIRYVGTCPFAGGTAHHVVVKTPLGKATLLLLPERPLASRLVASANGFEAAIVPARGGAVAIVSPSARAIVRIEALLGSS
ncbi:MAG: DUF3379 family protein [Pseudomonadota bacterium]